MNYLVIKKLKVYKDWFNIFFISFYILYGLVIYLYIIIL